MKKIVLIFVFCILSACNPSKKISQQTHEMSFCEDCISLEDVIEFEANYGSKAIELEQSDYKRMFLRCSPSSRCRYRKDDLFFIKTDTLNGLKELTHYEILPHGKNDELIVTEINKKVFYRDFKFDYYQKDSLEKKSFNYKNLTQLYYNLIEHYKIPKKLIFEGKQNQYILENNKNVTNNRFYYIENRDDYCCKNRTYHLSKKISNLEDISTAFKDDVSDKIDHINLEFTFTYSGNADLPGYDGYQEIPNPTPDFKNVIEKEDFGVFIKLTLNREGVKRKLFD